MANVRPPAPAAVVPQRGQHAEHKTTVVKDGYLPVNEILFDRPGAPSPFGEDVEFPLPVDSLSYLHPVAGTPPTH